MRPKEILLVLLIFGGAVVAVFFWPMLPSPMRPTPADVATISLVPPTASQVVPSGLVDLLILLDVSESLRFDDIQAEAVMALKYIQNNEEVPAHSTFRIAIADRDVERNEQDSGLKEETERYPVPRENQKKRWANREKRLSEAVGKYVSGHPDRKRTCLVETLMLVPNMFDNRPTAMRRRVLFISDMVEDCQNQGDPKTRDAMRQRIEKAGAKTKLQSLENIEVFAMVPKGQTSIAIDWVRQPWQGLLKEAGVSRFRIGPPEAFLGTSSSN